MKDGSTGAQSPHSRATLLVGTASIKIITTALNALTLVITARALGSGGRGSYFVIVTAATTAGVLGHLSIEHAQIFLWPRVEERDSLAPNAIAIGALNGFGSAIIAWAILEALVRSGVLQIDTHLLAIVLLAVPMTIIAMYLNGLLLLDDRIGRVNAGILLAALVQLVISVVAAGLHHLTLGVAVGVWIVGAVLIFIVGISAFDLSGWHVSLSLARRTVALGTRYHLGIASVYLLFRVDVFLLDGMVSKAQVGIYSLAVTIAELTYLLTDSTAQVVLPRQTSASLDESGRFTARAMRTNMVVAVVALAGLALASPYMVPVVFGRSFSGTAPALLALMPGVAALAVIRPVGGYLIRLNRPLTFSLLAGSAMVLNVGLNLVLIPSQGIVGASLASSAAYVLLAASYVAWLLRAASLPAGELVPRVADLRGPLLASLHRRKTLMKRA